MAVSFARCIGPLGGTTNLGDCVVAAACLLTPRYLVEGPAIAKYERKFADLIGVRHAYSFWAGRVGLYGLLQSLGIGPGDEVLLQVPTHIVVPNAIRYCGARPVYVDCSLDDCNMDLVHAERLITDQTRAIILQHTFGIPADVDAVLALANRYHLEVIEDCVHALGSTYGGKWVGGFGRAAFFSTEETKTISTTMGGVVVTDDAELAKRMAAFQARCTAPERQQTFRYVVKLIAYHLLMEPHVHRYSRRLYESIGRRNPLPQATGTDEMRGGRPARYAQRFSNAQAVLALRQLRRLESNLQHRREVARAYREGLAHCGFRLPQPSAKADAAYVRYPIWVEDRDQALQNARPDFVLGTWFTSVLEEAASLLDSGYSLGSCPRAEAAALHLVNLPTHPRVKKSDIGVLIPMLTAEAPRQERGKRESRDRAYGCR